jgi:hypothetical protein
MPADGGLGARSNALRATLLLKASFPEELA